MNRIKLFVILITLISFLLSFNLYGQKDTTEIIILHTNDMHAKIDNMAKLAYFVDKFEEKYNNVYLFSAGDNFTGNPIVDKYEKPGFPMIDLMNKIGFDLSCIGNHEFDYGQVNFNNYIKQAKFPFISANIEVKEEAVLNDPKDYYKFKTKDGVSIGVLGLIQTNKMGIPDCSPLKVKNINFEDPIKTAEKYINYKDSTDIYIALTHLGFKNDLKLAKKVPVFDIIIGGHSHTKLPNGELIGNTLLAHAGSYNNFLGVLTIKVLNNEILSKKDTLIDIKNNINYDKDIFEIVKQYNNNPDFSKVIGFADENITGKDELGSLITDGIRDITKVDIAFQNNGGIRIHEILKGNITKKQVLEMSPFGNTFIKYNLTPKQIKKLIKYSYSLNNNNELQVSGLQIYMQSNKKNKLKSVQLKLPKGEELDKEKYSVIINDYMASAYDLKFLKEGKKYDIIDSDNTINYIKKIKNIHYKGIKRVFDNNKKKADY